MKRLFILCSALKALMIRNPPNVSSTCDIRSLHKFCATSDLRFNILPTRPMNHPMNGRTVMVNKVNSQLVAIKVPK